MAAAKKKTKTKTVTNANVKAKTSIVAALIEALPEDLRDLVVERASIIFESGVAWDEAERVAYESETGRALPGIAKAHVKAVAEEEEIEPAPKTTRSRFP